MSDSLMLSHIYNLPQMIQEVARTFDYATRQTYSHSTCLSAKRIWLVGCGDGHHAAQAMEMLFTALTGVPTTAITSMRFSRYAATYLPDTGPNSNLVIGISSSGKTSRTLEAIKIMSPTNSATVALTANPESELARSAQFVQLMVRPPIEGKGVPGVRSYLGMLLGLGFAALRVGEVRGRITPQQAIQWRGWLRGMGAFIQRTIENCDSLAKDLASSWRDHCEYVFLGSGPNHGTALVATAHLLEATGDTAVCQEVEEWAHLQYWNRKIDSPTFLITAAQRDGGRSVEVATAAHGLGHPIAAVVPHGNQVLGALADVTLPFADGLPEELTPFVACIPPMLFAAYRAEATQQAYFRRGTQPDPREGGQTSRVQSSERIDHIISWSA